MNSTTNLLIFLDIFFLFFKLVPGETAIHPSIYSFLISVWGDCRSSIDIYMHIQTQIILIIYKIMFKIIFKIHLNTLSSWDGAKSSTKLVQSLPGWPLE